MSFLSQLFGTKSETLKAIKNLNVAEFKMAINGKKVQLVDVRTSSEFSAGHIKNAANIDVFNSAAFEKKFEKYQKETPVYVYCRSGARSMSAAKKLVKMGFTEVVNLKGGYSAWT
tara:strand:- start:50332 stop:50676 length:345 start_codon:yes stop_codon:yes gene_type:complete